MFAVVIVAGSDNYAEGGGEGVVVALVSRNRHRVNGVEGEIDAMENTLLRSTTAVLLAAELIVVSILGELLTLLIE